MKQNKSPKTKPKVTACPIMNLKDKNDLFMISSDNWNTQDNRTFIMNADFRQMDSARDKK
ncbi:hypothetical protein [Maridesulfovibrio salexigens]|uniref:Uncharacterized protein n=1 Tax=Maridesulfovibrio salexigens (strain ATCC 14822 / DSM 2638 / NCIMB 8403 / VKM B-1763) TaxID=526222 RepID=C6BYM6_MARSD|nr:hypothetical protein [Maridesulfovibrio salexigens]ACS80633.1 hypothetical protein Desal_2578 [Maridesulfovibrio salexigens DSM 2638]